MTTRAAKTSDAALTQTITREVAKRVVGQEVMVERLLIGLLTGGHLLLQGGPRPPQNLARHEGAGWPSTRLSRLHVTPHPLPTGEIGTAVFHTRTPAVHS